MVIVTDARAPTRPLPALTALVDGVRTRLLADASNRAPFFDTARAALSHPPGAAHPDFSPDDAVRAFVRDAFPGQWVLRDMRPLALAGEGGEVALAGALVDTWLDARGDSYRAQCLEFLLTTTVLHALAHALHTHLLGESGHGAQCPCAEALERKFWGGTVGAMCEEDDDELDNLVGVYMAVERGSRKVEVQLSATDMERALSGSSFGPVELDLEDLSLDDGLPVDIIRRRGSCTPVEEDDHEDVPTIAPWGEVLRRASPPLSPPELIYNYDSDGYDDDDSDE